MLCTRGRCKLVPTSSPYLPTAKIIAHLKTERWHPIYSTPYSKSVTKPVFGIVTFAQVLRFLPGHFKANEEENLLCFDFLIRRDNKRFGKVHATRPRADQIRQCGLNWLLIGQGSSTIFRWRSLTKGIHWSSLARDCSQHFRTFRLNQGGRKKTTCLSLTFVSDVRVHAPPPLLLQLPPRACMVKLQYSGESHNRVRTSRDRENLLPVRNDLLWQTGPTLVPQASLKFEEYANPKLASFVL